MARSLVATLSLATIALAGSFSGSQTAAPEPSYTGAGSCAASNCHGAVWPKTGGEALQNEYYVWSTRDKHSKAYSALLEPRSRQIARNLKIGAPENSNLCLNCHATNVAEQRRAKSFVLSDGVGCESCHGAASLWLGPHTRRDWTPADSRQAGMVDTENLEIRIGLCAGCHIGSEDKRVDHDLLAAGHPALVFELDTFSALMPRHWRENENQWEGVKRWAVGQAVGLREAMRQLSFRASGEAWTGWPDFADFECFSCHHDLTLPSQRQARGYRGRPGVPPWDDSRFLMIKVFQKAASLPDEGLDAVAESLRDSLQNAFAKRERVAESARGIVGKMDSLLARVQRLDPDRALARRLISQIAADANVLAASGIRSAEQAAMAVDAFYNAFKESTGQASPALDNHINRLYQALQSTSRYDPDHFEKLLKETPRLFDAAGGNL